MSLTVTRHIRSKDIADHVRAEIGKRKIPADAPIMSTRELAGKFNVSMLTANRALNRLVDEEVIYRIQGSGTFVKGEKNATRRLIIGFIDAFTDTGERGFHAAHGIFIDNCLSRLRERHCETQYYSYQELLENAGRLEKFKSLHGLVIGSGCVDARTLPTLNSLNIPITVYRNEFVCNLPFNQVIPDLSAGFKEIFKMLNTKDLKEIVIITASHTNAKARCQSFYDQAISSGIPAQMIKEVDLEIFSGDTGRQAGYQCAKEILKDVNGKLIFSTSDFISFGVIDAMREKGIVPGRDAQLISYDNLEAYGMMPYERPIITSVDYPKDEIARRAVDLTILQARNNDHCQHIIKVPTHLIIRETALNIKNIFQKR